MNSAKPLEVRKTANHEMFKKLGGNRTVEEIRVKKIIQSIKKVGYIPSPIIVNENYEVIDGQGRLEATKRLNLPIYYMVVEGIGIDECIAMNINQTNWRIIDYIQSHADTGNVSYVYLLQLVKTYEKVFQNKVIFYVTTGLAVESVNNSIKDGRFVCTVQDFNRAQKILSWLKGFKPSIDRVGGHTEFYYMALAFCSGDEEVDNERLFNKITALRANLIPVSTMLQALEQIEDIYNTRARQKVYISTNYRKYLDGKYPWYSAKYGYKYGD